MSSAFMRESGGTPQIFASRESAESRAAMWRAIEGVQWDYEVRARDRGGFMVARLDKRGQFESWVEE